MSVLFYKDFKELFKGEYEEYSLLYEKAEAKKKAIMENNIEELAKILTEEQDIIDKIEELEEKRHSILSEAEVEESKKVISFNRLMELMPEERAELEKLKEDFLELLDSLQKINEENKELIEDSLKITESSLEIIRQATGRGNLYTNNGDDTDDQGEHIIDKRV